MAHDFFSGNDYTYDVNGNLTADANKKITSIGYNYLNLPQLLAMNKDDNTAKGTIQYVYDATGNKLRKVVTENGNVAKVTTTTYIGGYVYEKVNTATPALQFFAHEEGRVRELKDANNEVTGGEIKNFSYPCFRKPTCIDCVEAA